MSKLRDACEQYLQLRHALGFQLRCVARLLRSFVTFAEMEGATQITTELGLRWAQQPANVQPATWASRLKVVRHFATWLSASDRHTQVPPAGLLPWSYRRKRPYIYSDVEIEGLVRAAERIPSALGLKGRTLATVFGLLSVTGLRVGEAIALDREDVDLKEGILQVRRAKFGKSRLVAVHDSTCRALADYASLRDRVVHRPATTAFLVSEKGDRLADRTARYNFAKVSRGIGARQPQTTVSIAVRGCTTCGIDLSSVPYWDDTGQASTSNARCRN